MTAPIRRFCSLLLLFAILGLLPDASALAETRPPIARSPAAAAAPSAASTTASSARPVPAPGKVIVTLLVVAATDSNDQVDPRLEALTQHLRFLRYRGYNLLDSYVSEIAPGAETTFTIDGGRRVTVSLLQKSPERAQFRVQMFSQSGKLLDTTLSVNRNGTFIVAGPKYGDGILILPLQVTY